MSESAIRAVFLMHLAATLYMVGLIWFVQVVHYPLFSKVDAAGFTAYENMHTRLTTWVVAPPMLIEAATAALLLWRPPALVGLMPLVTGAGLIAVNWLSTFFVQVPCHNRLCHCFDMSVHRRLVTSNWMRTAAWSARGVLVLWMAGTMMEVSSA